LGSSRRSAAVAALLLLPGLIVAQQQRRGITLAGRLLRVAGRDTVPVPGARVVAHRVGRTRQGPIDSMRTDVRGAFRFAVPVADSGAVYVVSTLYQGLGYFSEPVTIGTAAMTNLDLQVFDTSSAGPPLEVAMRNVVVSRGATGDRRILDIVQVENVGGTARVGPDTLTPTWSARLPEGAGNPQPGASDVPPTSIRFAAGRVNVIAPFPPGDKQVVVTYSMPADARSLTVPVDHNTEQVELLLEDSTAQPPSAFQAADPSVIEGHTFRRFTALALKPGTSFTVRFGDTRGSQRRATLVAAIAAGLALLLGAAYALTRRRGAATALTPRPAGASADTDFTGESQERLLAQVAALDARFDGRQAETSADAWSRYQTRRAALKAELQRRLAPD